MIKNWIAIVLSLSLGAVPTIAAQTVVSISKVDACYSRPKIIKFTVTNRAHDSLHVNVALEAKLSDGLQEVQASLLPNHKWGNKVIVLKKLDVNDSLLVLFNPWEEVTSRADVPDTYLFRVDTFMKNKRLSTVYSPAFIIAHNCTYAK